MKRRRWLLAVAAGLFAAWIAYLGFLALTASHPTVLSHPQFLVADLWVIAEVNDFDKPVKVVEVTWAREDVEKPEKDATVEVSNLARCKEEGTKAGRYILPLTREGKGYRVTDVPHSPGYGPLTPQCRVYPDTPETRGQLDRLPRP
ncbi:MAG TPA: hypothetical protein VKA46_01205 [Gemmataceae bacterium]|nr:hypothetical protein [Gemmataceae bacterium]